MLFIDSSIAMQGICAFGLFVMFNHIKTFSFMYDHTPPDIGPYSHFIKSASLIFLFYFIIAYFLKTSNSNLGRGVIRALYSTSSLSSYLN